MNGTCLVFLALWFIIGIGLGFTLTMLALAFAARKTAGAAPGRSPRFNCSTPGCGICGWPR